LKLKQISTIALAVILATFLACDSGDLIDPNNVVDRNITDVPDGKKSVFVYTRTIGERHAGMNEGVNLIRDLGSENNFHVNNSEDQSDFTFDRLSQHDGLVLLNAQGDIFDSEAQVALEQFVQEGGAVVAIHAAADIASSWPWYGELIGARPTSHVDFQSAKLLKEHDRHPSMLHVGPEWFISDDWYNYSTNPRNNSLVVVLASLDEASIVGGEMGEDHPIAWAQRSGGKVWYTGLGHDARSFANGAFQEHLLGGILWAIDHFDRVPE